MIFLYKILTDLNPYYYSILIMVFFLSSFIGYHIYRKIHLANQSYTVTKEKIREDNNLITNHMKNRQAEVAAMGKKIDSLLKLKNIADKLSLALSDQEIMEIVAKETFEIFGEDSVEAILLRDFRDNVLNTTPIGQDITKLYYDWSPAIVRGMEDDETFKEEVKEMVDTILPLIDEALE